MGAAGGGSGLGRLEGLRQHLPGLRWRCWLCSCCWSAQQAAVPVWLAAAVVRWCRQSPPSAQRHFPAQHANLKVHVDELGGGQEAGGGVDRAVGVVELEVGGLWGRERRAGRCSGCSAWHCDTVPHLAASGLSKLLWWQGSCQQQRSGQPLQSLTFSVRARLASKNDLTVPISSQ